MGLFLENFNSPSSCKATVSVSWVVAKCTTICFLTNSIQIFRTTIWRTVSSVNVPVPNHEHQLKTHRPSAFTLQEEGIEMNK
jgi:hypothetical protein